MIDSLAGVPVLVWAGLGLLAAVAARYAQLWLWARQSRNATHDPVRTLQLLADGLATYAKHHGGALPASLDGDDWAFARMFAVRPMPRWGLDGRLIIAHDRTALRRLIEFPHLRSGRVVLFGSGKIVLVSEAQFQQLLHADDRLRATLGLETAASPSEHA